MADARRKKTGSEIEPKGMQVVSLRKVLEDQKIAGRVKRGQFDCPGDCKSLTVVFGASKQPRWLSIVV